MQTKAIIEIKNLSAGYDGRNVLHDVNLTVYERDFLGIIGPNGGGKTTLIKCILGLLKPTGGSIQFYPETLSIGYLPQYNTIDRKFPISVEEVILSGLSIQKKLSARFTADEREKGKQIIARMGLEGLEKRSIGQLSGGQLQRALLGRAIISDPEEYRHVSIRGLMGMASNTDDEVRVAADFATLKGLFDAARSRFGLPRFDTLSMGMSHDYGIAVREGSNMVRVGTTIFGDRQY